MVAGRLDMAAAEYEQFRDNEVDGRMLLDLVSNAVLAHLVENPLHQSRLCSQLAAFERRASGGGAPAADGGGDGEDDVGACAPGTRRP